MKSKKKPPARRRPSPAPKPRKAPPPFPVSDAERNYWRDWLIAQSKLPREPRLDPTALNRETLRALQIIIDLLQLCPCQIEKRTHISHQHQRKLRLAAATDGNHHLSLHTFTASNPPREANPSKLQRIKGHSPLSKLDVQRSTSLTPPCLSAFV